MSLLAQALRPRAVKSAGVPSISEDGSFITAPLSWLPWLAGPSSATTAEGSLALPTIYACVRVLSEDVASLPLILYRRLPGGGKERATDHDLYPVLHDAPNPEMTSFTWRETLMTHVLTWGNAPCEKIYDTFGRLQLWPLPPSRVEYHWEKGRKVYDYLSDGGKKRMKDGSVFHVMGQSLNGLVGLSPIALHRETLGEQKATRDFGRNFYRNNARPATVLKHPKTISEPAQERLKAQMDALKGTTNAGKTVLLEEGLDFAEIGIPPEDAQYIETRKLQREEAAQLFRMPPHKVGILDHATFSNIEHSAIDYVTGTLRPWLVRIEQAIKTQLLANEPDLYAEFLVDGLLRGDAKSRAEALAIRWQHGTLTPDEWRGLENENALAEGTGSNTYVPVNYQAVTAVGDELVVDEAEEFPPLFAVKMARFDCPDCGKLINRVAAPATVGYCRSCKAEKTMAGTEAAEPETVFADIVAAQSKSTDRIADALVDLAHAEGRRTINIDAKPVPAITVEAAPTPTVIIDTTQFAEALHGLTREIVRQREESNAPKRREIERDADGRMVAITEWQEAV